ncbi:hypothetical protein CANINC_003261 [Pichia inconspicua]|uniref:SEC7 domain-containing protein n=1 Tax=Pichia inconspicua TaxID=52247 RepID=A0A4V4NFI1_9ASCO|nr:hypothetical protein CANINC_003261 [[Candida] inconspicua]
METESDIHSHLTRCHDLTIFDPLAFVIEECTFILNSMRKNNKSTTNPFAAILINQFLNDNSYPEESIATSRGNLTGNATNNNTNANTRSNFKDDDHFLAGFLELRSILSETNNLNSIDVITLLQPFLVVIKAPTTSCHITNLAINALSKFCKYNIINVEQPNIVQALAQIVSTLAHCRFEGADQTQDDILLVKIIQLLEYLVTSKLGELLTDDSIYEIISTCFSLAINTRRRDMLRSTAETSLLTITQVVFSKLEYLESKPEIDHNTKSAQVEFSNDLLPDDTTGRSTPVGELSESILESNEDQHANELSEIKPTELENQEDSKEVSDPDQHDAADTLSFTTSNTDLPPFGIACMREFLSHTVNIISPENRYRFTESTRCLALEILIRIVEVTGRHLFKHSQLFGFISDNCCHHLVQIIQNAESTVLIKLSLKLTLHFALTFPNLLKIQLELIFVTIFQSIIADETAMMKDLSHYNDMVFEMSRKGKFETSALTETEITELRKEFETGSSPQTKEFLIEALSVLWCRSPYLFTNLFKSYDCDFDRMDLSNSFIKLLCRLSYSDCSLMTTGNVPPICLDGLLSFVNGIYNRVLSAKEQELQLKDIKENTFIDQYKKKSDFISCVNLWNDNPSKGLEALHSKGFIKDPSDDVEVALFLFTNSGRIDKKKLGELLAKAKNANLLKQFVSLLDFKNLRPDEALRMLLNYFRLPGEAQQIDRIVSTFNDRYIECQEESDDPTLTNDPDTEEEKVLPDSDAMFVLSFSIIMLNTDLHNPNVKKPMTLTDYQRNLRGCYKGKDFPHWYTEKMYNSIRDKEIIMPEEHKGSAKWFETVWHSLVAEQDSRILTDGELVNELWTSKNNSELPELLAFDKVLFEKHYKDLISTFVIMFDDATHDSIITKMMSTIEKCAVIAIYFEMESVVDSIVEITSHLSTLTGIKVSEHALEQHEIIPIIEITTQKEGESSMYVSDASVILGRDYRAQLSLIVLFRILKRSNFNVTKGWFYTIKAILKIFEIGLLNPNVFEEFQNRLHFDRLRKPSAEFKLDRSDVDKEAGLFSTFSSYLKGLSAETFEPTEEEIELTNTAVDFLNTIGINKLFFNVSKTKDVTSMNKLVQILFALFPNKSENTERFYFEGVLFLCEISVCYLLITKNSKLINQLFLKIDSVLKDHENEKEMKMSTICRFLSYKLLLFQTVPHNEANQKAFEETIDKIYTLSTNTKESFVKHGYNILTPLEQLIVNSDSWCQNAVSLNNKYWCILRAIASLPKNTDSVYEFIANIFNEHSEVIIYENFMDILGLLDEISAVGAYGAQWEHEYDKLIDSGLKVEDKTNPYQELVNVAKMSITLTSQLYKVFDNESFVKSIQEKKEKGVEIVEPWYPLIEAISHQCYNPCRQVRNHAIKTLNTLLISNEQLPVQELSIDKIMDSACLRLMVELMKPEVNGTDVRGMVKTQRDVLAFTCKVILTHNFENIEIAVEKLFAIASQLLQKNRKIYPHTGNEDEFIELLRNLLMIRKEELDLVKLKGYKMDGALKKMVEEVIKEEE